MNDQHPPVSSLPPPEALLPQRVRHALRFRRLQVRAVRHLPGGFIRVILSGDELAGFVSAGFDDHCKLFFPDAEGVLQLPGVDAEGRPEWPTDGPRPVARDYTPREHDAVAGTLTIDFAVHEAGLATAWARRAQPGEVLGVGGPRGSFVLSPDFDWHLLVGDASAVPAICRRIGELPDTARIIAVIEVDATEGRPELPAHPGLLIHWADRQGQAAGDATALLGMLQSLVLPTEGQGHAWVAAESGVARRLRDCLRNEHGLHPRRIKAAAYWKLGASGVHESIED